MRSEGPKSGMDPETAERLKLWPDRRGKDLGLERAIQSGQITDEDEFGLRPPKSASTHPSQQPDP